MRILVVTHDGAFLDAASAALGAHQVVWATGIGHALQLPLGDVDGIVLHAVSVYYWPGNALHCALQKLLQSVARRRFVIRTHPRFTLPRVLPGDPIIVDGEHAAAAAVLG